MKRERELSKKELKDEKKIIVPETAKTLVRPLTELGKYRLELLEQESFAFFLSRLI